MLGEVRSSDGGTVNVNVSWSKVSTQLVFVIGCGENVVRQFGVVLDIVGVDLRARFPAPL